MQQQLRLVSIAILLAGCSTTRAAVPPPPAPGELTPELRLRNVEEQQLNLQYEMEVRECFYNLRFCNLEGKTGCWPAHEKCVIEATNKYRYLLQKRGFKTK